MSPADAYLVAYCIDAVAAHYVALLRYFALPRRSCGGDGYSLTPDPYHCLALPIFIFVISLPARESWNYFFRIYSFFFLFSENC
jgi:hypothetical protein